MRCTACSPRSSSERCSNGSRTWDAAPSPRPKAVRLDLEGRSIRGVAVSLGGGQAAYTALDSLDPVARGLSDASALKWTHDAKDTEAAVIASGRTVAGVAFDTMLAAHLLDPAGTTFDLSALSQQYLGSDLLAGLEAEAEGDLFGQSWRVVAAEAVAVALLTPALAERIDRAGLRRLLDEVEMPLSTILARMQA